MALTGLHNVSVFRPFFGESQSPGSSRWGEQQGRPSTRTSSLLQMWREFEDEHVVNPSCQQRQRRSNGSDSDYSSTCTSVGQGSDNKDDISEDADDTRNQRIIGSDINHEDDDSTISEQSSDLGEIERERVRQIFREWMNSGAKGHSPERFHVNNQSGPQCLGQNECERVRIIREWVQMNSQHRNNCGSLRDGIAEVGSQIEQVRDGLVITHPGIGARRPVRRLCGRQTLLDLIMKDQSERHRELQDLSEQRPVSDFVHRNRIQAFLRGRFLRNEISIPDKRPSSIAASELGLLRQRHAVTDLREGFLSKLDDSVSTPINNADSSSFSSDETNVESESTCREREVAAIHTASDLESAADGNRSLQGNIARVTELEGSVLDAEGYVQEVSLDVRSVCGCGEVPVLETEASKQEVLADVEHGGNRQAEQNNAAITNELPLANENTTYSGPLEVFHEPCEPRSGSGYVHEVAGNTSEEFDRQDASTQVEEIQEPEIEIEDNAWQRLTGVEFMALTDARGEDMTRSWQESSANQSFQEISHNDAVEQDQMQAPLEVWPHHDLQEAIDRWLDMPSGEFSESVGRTVRLYYPDDDDHVQSMELRELLSRRHVSSLLRSSFRESLEQVLQSHVERPGHASGDWELDTTSFPYLIELDQELVNGNQTLAPADGTEINLFDSSLTQITESQPHWDEELQGANWPHNSSNQNLRTEWELINEIRIDMARLHQRMNNMQNMMEVCMELQIELQRSVSQEVSAALNRSILSGDADLSSEGNMLHNESQWDYVRKGVCCQCRDSNIDSLLYRCGHMCTCSKCAEILVQHRGKCPMCHAPVVEAVRAYFIQ